MDEQFFNKLMNTPLGDLVDSMVQQAIPKIEEAMEKGMSYEEARKDYNSKSLTGSKVWERIDAYFAGKLALDQAKGLKI